MTSLARSRLNTLLALAIPTGGFLYLAFSDSQHPYDAGTFASGVTFALGTLWLAAVVTLTTFPVESGSRVVRPRDLTGGAQRRAERPSYVVDVSEPVKPWRWTSALLAPLELLAVTWSVPVIILLIMVPIGLALVSALWLGRLVLNLF